MSRKAGTSYPVDDAWRKRVEKRLSEKNWTRADLAREAAISKSTVTELLNGTVNSSVDLPRIHRALDLEWSAAHSVVSDELGQLISMWEGLDEFGRGRVLERTRSVYEEQVMRQRAAGK